MVVEVECIDVVSAGDVVVIIPNVGAEEVVVDKTIVVVREVVKTPTVDVVNNGAVVVDALVVVDTQ